MQKPSQNPGAGPDARPDAQSEQAAPQSHPSTLRHLLVFDVGGSHISAALCEESTYALRGISRAPLPADGLNNASEHEPAHRFLRLIHALAERVAHSAGFPLANVAGAALAMPGPFDYENGISHLRHKLQSLLGVDLKTALASRFDLEPNQFRFVNDAAAFLLGEIAAGSAHGFARSIGITLGTGIGCAFATNERIAIPADQPNGDLGVPPGGEIWNLPYNRATVEDFVSTRFLRSRYLSLTGLEADVSDVAAIAHCQDNQPCRALEEVQAHQARTAQVDHIPHLKSGREARRAFSDFGLHLAQVLNQHASAFHPEIIVLGGGIARASGLFLSATQGALAFPAKISISTLMDEAPLAGAARHWFDWNS